MLHWIDIGVLLFTIAFIVVYGIWQTRKTSSPDASFLRGQEETPWWQIGISVMATQASAITFMSTPGQAYFDGMGFVQFYFGLPLAMVIISVFFIPLFHKLKVYTAYEYLEQRFDTKTRSLTAFLFLVQRGLGTGITIYAPSIVLSTIFGWNLSLLNIVIGFLVIVYTLSGGTKAVAVTQQQQMLVMIGGMVIVFITSIRLLPDHLSFGDALHIAGQSNKLNVLDFSFDLNNRYTLWSGLTGGMFLALSYFGTDQSQVQRYITGNSIKESRMGLMFNGLLKIPMQFFILFCGIMVFIFFQFNQAPLHFNEHLLTTLQKEPQSKEILAKSQAAYDEVLKKKQMVLTSDLPNKAATLERLNEQEGQIRKEVGKLIDQHGKTKHGNEKDYVFIYFVIKYLPIGIIGILLAVIFCAAMSATASGINALATSSTIDFYKNLWAQNKTEKEYIQAGRWFTLLWGIVAIVFANLCPLFENLIQFVNIIGSLFYGTILGIFITGIFTKSIGSTAVWIAAILTELFIFYLYFNTKVEYLWFNPIGCLLVLVIAWLIENLPFNNKAKGGNQPA